MSELLNTIRVLAGRGYMQQIKKGPRAFRGPVAAVCRLHSACAY